MKNKTIKGATTTYLKMMVACAVFIFIGMSSAFSQSYISETAAMSLLLDEYHELEEILSSQTQGTDTYNKLSLKIAVYGHTYEQLENQGDITVDGAINEAGEIVTKERSQYDPLATSGDVAVIESQLRNLLSN